MLSSWRKLSSKKKTKKNCDYQTILMRSHRLLFISHPSSGEFLMSLAKQKSKTFSFFKWSHHQLAVVGSPTTLVFNCKESEIRCHCPNKDLEVFNPAQSSQVQSNQIKSYQRQSGNKRNKSNQIVCHTLTADIPLKN